MRSTRQLTLTGVFFLGMMVIFTSVYSQPKAKASAQGQTIFKTNCILCHGADGSGQTPVGQQFKVRDLRSGEVQRQSNAQLAAIITKGKGKMPPFEKNLNKEQVTDLVIFIRQLAKKG